MSSPKGRFWGFCLCSRQEKAGKQKQVSTGNLAGRLLLHQESIILCWFQQINSLASRTKQRLAGGRFGAGGDPEDLAGRAGIRSRSGTYFSDRLRALGEFCPDFGPLSDASSHVIILNRCVPVG